MLFKSTAIVAVMTFLSRILGLARDIIFATFFGADGGTDAFFVAFKIPNFMRRLFAEGAFSQAFVPVFSEYKETRSFADLKDLINHVAGSLGGFLLILSIIGSLAAPLLVYIFAPGFADESRFQLTADMLAITFPYIFFIALTAFAGGILNSYNKFAVPAFTPVLLNLSLISAALWGAEYFTQPIMALAWGVAFAGFLQLLFQTPFLAKLKLLPKPQFKRAHEGVKKIQTLMLPAIIGSSVAQINLLLDTIIASFLIAGSVSWLYYSDRLVEFPLGVFGIALATVILPSLSKQHANQSNEQFNQTLDWALKLVTLIALPAALGLLLLASPLLATLFGYGEFTLHDTEMSSLSLMAYALGLPAFIYIKVLAPGFYARQDTKTPMRIGIQAMIANMFLNLLFVIPMVMTEFEGPHTGLALATSGSAYMNAFMLYRGLKRQGIYKHKNGWGKLLIQALIANTLMAAFLIQLTPSIDNWLAWPLIERIPYLLGFVTIAATIYITSLFICGFRLKHLQH
ncbi:MAG: murein biosynthesis integral membrane protein MurJ [endosymbiont of Galathealinum brachiosum]|uniref:Probable lipid II flippase MurJ n=1 Tax=endosymbiont of Galathealinum brachiosum TaxID=2200906 RepID=A0A370DDD3_9GAMM|nr:MAG: murein biosynthesis integral membrane protein MurJ [endosymbiont of Galathealinum brachiosum]